MIVLPEGVVSLRAYAKSRGISDTSVQKAIKAEHIKNGLYKIDGVNRGIYPEIANKEWKSTYNPLKAQQPLFVNEEQSDDTDEKNKAPDSMAVAKKARAIYQAQEAKLDYEERIGKLVDKKKTYDTLYAFGVSVKKSILEIPDRVIDDILASPSRNEAHTILLQALNDSLRKLSENIEE